MPLGSLYILALKMRYTRKWIRAEIISYVYPRQLFMLQSYFSFIKYFIVCDIFISFSFHRRDLLWLFFCFVLFFVFVFVLFCFVLFFQIFIFIFICWNGNILSIFKCFSFLALGQLVHGHQISNGLNDIKMETYRK